MEEEDWFYCPDCGWEGDDPNWDDEPYCPECGAEVYDPLFDELLRLELAA